MNLFEFLTRGLFQKVTKLFIDGQWILGAGNEREIINPANKEVLDTIFDATPDQISEAISAARNAFERTDWATNVSRRVKVLRHTANALSQHAEEIARIETKNTGKPIRESRLDVEDSITCLQYYADLVEKRTPWIKTMADGTTSCVVEEPIGVTGLIVPWNFPLLLAVWKLAPAIAAGNTIVLKPSELTPLSITRLAGLLHESGLPEGVFNLVLGDGEVGQAIVRDPRVDKISFTGSVPTGQKIYAQCAESMKRVSLELGGKSPLIIFEDIDLDDAVDWMMFGSYFNQGEVCVASSRILVSEKILKTFTQRLIEHVQKIKIDNPMLEETELGPLISASHMAKVQSYVELGKNEGARCLIGGKSIEQKTGYFFQPTVFVDVEQDMRIVQEEIFGPVATIQSFTDEEEAIELANGTKYGLAAGIFTKDTTRAQRVASQIRAGTIWINGYHTPYVEAPWGGFKFSGIGRELGPHGLANYVEYKHINVRPKLDKLGWYSLQ